MFRYRGLLMATMVALVLPVALHAQQVARRARVADTDRAAIEHRALTAFQSLPLAFEENRGQFEPSIRYAARRAGMVVTLDERGFLVDLMSRIAAPHTPTDDDDVLGLDDVIGTNGRHVQSACDSDPLQRQALRFEFVGSLASTELDGRRAMSGRYHYLRGTDASRWVQSAPIFAAVHYTDVYPGIDFEIYDAGGTLEYDVLAEPGADLRQVVIRCDGADQLEIDDAGNLVARTSLGCVRHKKPVTYRVSATGVRTQVDSRFVMLSANQFGFEAAGAASDALIIDPGLLYSTIVGAAGQDQGTGVAVDTEGMVYICGQTTSLHFPSTTDLTPGLDPTRKYQANRFYKDDTDVFVIKFDLTRASGDQIVYATVLGGSDNDSPANVKVDSSGAAYLSGQTFSDDFPTTPGTYQGVRNGPYDIFASKLDPSGGVLEYSTYIGGSGGDYAFGLTIDAFGYLYMTGGSDSPDFPTTPGAFDSAPGADVNGFAAKLDTTGTSLIYSTYLDGNGFDDGWDIKVNATGEAFITGRSSSPDFPTTPGVFDSTWNGSLDTFVLELSADGSLVMYCTFVAALRRDEGHALVLDPSGIYVTGVARSEDFPVTPGAFDTSENDGYDAYAFKLDPTMTTLIYSTFLGGKNHDVGWDIGVDVLGQVYLTGVSYSPDFPTTVGSLSPDFNGLTDAYISKFDTTASQLLYSTYLGKGGAEEGISLAMGGVLQNQVYLTGHTFSRFFPTTSNAYDRSWNGGYDTFLVWLDPISKCEATSVEYGTGWPGTSGIPSLTVDKKPIICSDFSLLVGNSFGALTQAVIFVGLLPTDVPTDFGGHLLVAPNILVSLPLSPGTNALPLLYTCDANLCGLIAYLQVLEIDPGASNGIAFTPGLELVIGTE